MGVINGISYRITDTYITVYDSYKIKKNDFKQFLIQLRSEQSERTIFKKRSNCSLSNEWAVHTFLYKLNIEPDRTKNADMQWPLTWWEKILYPCTGWFCKIWLK